MGNRTDNRMNPGPKRWAMPSTYNLNARQLIPRSPPPRRGILGNRIHQPPAIVRPTFSRVLGRGPTGAYKKAKDLALFNQLKRDGGWNRIKRDGKVARFRCGVCGMLVSIGYKDTEGEFEVKCRACGHVMVFNRTPPAGPKR